MSQHPEIDDTITAVLAAIRAVVAEHQGAGAGAGGRAEASRLITELINQHGPKNVGTAAIFFAEAAASAFENVSASIGDPVDRILQKYEEHIRLTSDFHLIWLMEHPPAGEDPSD